MTLVLLITLLYVTMIGNLALERSSVKGIMDNRRLTDHIST